MSTIRKTHTEAWWDKAPATTIRCRGHYTDGTACRSEASPGATVCWKHGAAAPQVQAAAATRIQYSVDEAAQRLVDWMKDEKVDMRERVKIAHDLLDRGGLGATAKTLIGVVTEDPVEKLFRNILSDPNGTYDPNVVGPKQILPDPAQAAIDAVEGEGEWDTPLALENGSSRAEDVVDAELVDDELPAHTVRVEGNMSHNPPKHIREGVEQYEVLVRAGLW